MKTTNVIRRSQLITPANSEKLILKALAAPSDSVILDLEDAIAPSSKADARETLRRTLSNLDTKNFGHKEIGVRVNGLDTPWCLDDLLAIQGLPINTVVVPKIHVAQDLQHFDTLLNMLELRGGSVGLTLQALIESARGLENAAAIAQSSARCSAIIFGVGDYMADTGVEWDSALVMAARLRIVNAAAASGIPAIDHVHPVIEDAVGVEAAARSARALGFAGKWAIHPVQIAPIHAGFTPDPERIERAHRIIAAYEAALRRGEGAIKVDGALVDEAVLKIAQRDIALASLALCN